MKNFSYKALAVASAAVCGATAHAGSFTSTPAKFAVEALTSKTAVTVPNVVYTMGVARVVSQPFTIILREPAGATTTLACGSVPTLTSAGGGAVNVTVKRTGSNECVYDVNVTANIAVGDTFTFNGVSLNNHGLASVGGSESLNIALFDTGETARVDNSTDKTNVVATSNMAVTMTATADTHTTADVNFNGGNNPLFGFVAGLSQTSATVDTSTVTYANFGLNVDGTFVNAAGNAVTAATLLTNVVVTISGDFSGLNTTFSAGNSTIAANSGAISAVTYTAGVPSSTAVFTIAGAAMGASVGATGATNFQVGLMTAQTQSLNTTRTFGVSAVVNPVVGAQESLAGNSSWWTWKANAIQLATAFFNNDTTNGNLTRFFFQNVGGSSAGYSATCYGESGVTPTYGLGKTGTLIAGTTMVKASDICTWSAGQRGSIVFTINSAASKIKGVYQQAINGAAAAYIPLERPYGAGTY